MTRVLLSIQNYIKPERERRRHKKERDAKKIKK